ncbi:hypothetical protein CORT_0A07760 [Candida orthopsilosis Co 90-125]|uniref:Exosome complex protein n=1 Tax=Candida orthopsilosis (strain 90-125) TaxID=1136231 RepID=H8WX22_CANO9|nr:hypothetical protein CORT_0A07760 [Candida orthopsilosis Co 90-125]CCG21162.1 hypothetical protein CORT_0A07760 [Candida orthopsilosis Co 90-125]
MRSQKICKKNSMSIKQLLPPLFNHINLHIIMDNLGNIELYLKSLDQSILQYEPTLEPLLSRTLDEHLAQQSTAQDKIKFLNNFQYVLISTIYSYLKTIGIDTEVHPIKKELARVKSYMMRAKNMENNKNDEQNVVEKEKTKEFLTRTLGVKNGDASTVKDVGPAISSQNFQGTHTRFEEEEEEEEDDDDDEKSDRKAKSESSKEAVSKTPIESVKRGKLKKKDKSSKQKDKSMSKNKVTKVKHGYLPPRSDKLKKSKNK